MRFYDTEDHFPFTNRLRDRTLDTVALLRSENPQEWYCNTNSSIIIVRYQAGMLTMGVGESEYEAINDINEARIVGMVWEEYEAAERGEEYKNKADFDDIKEFMMWKFDDDIICNGKE